jgi:hypothetical protein
LNLGIPNMKRCQVFDHEIQYLHLVTGRWWQFLCLDINSVQYDTIKLYWIPQPKIYAQDTSSLPHTLQNHCKLMLFAQHNAFITCNCPSKPDIKHKWASFVL